MSEIFRIHLNVKPGDMAIVVQRDGASYAPDCGPGVIGTVKAVCACSYALACAIAGSPVVEFETPDSCWVHCIHAQLLRKIDPPGEERGKWDECPWQPAKKKRPLAEPIF